MTVFIFTKSAVNLQRKEKMFGIRQKENTYTIDIDGQTLYKVSGIDHPVIRSNLLKLS